MNAENVQLTKKQKAVFDFIKSGADEKGYPPSYEEIMANFNFSSPNTVTCYMKQLTKKGFIRSEYKKSRAITLLK